MNKDKEVWEQVGNYRNRLDRVNVPGGWLVKIEYVGQATAICFYPDPEHLWEEIK